MSVFIIPNSAWPQVVSPVQSAAAGFSPPSSALRSGTSTSGWGRRYLNVLGAFLCACVSLPASVKGEEPIAYTYPELVHRIYDMEALARPPLPGERGAAASSYDRTSKYNALTQRYENWGANDDGTGVVRKEGDADVLAEIAGPGVIWRVWSAAPRQGNIQIFIDGGSTPVIDMPFRDLFRNDKGPFAYSALNREMARGFNLFVPIAFQKSCKIVGQPGWGKYFHCTYTQLPEGTQVPSFDGNFSVEERAALSQAQDIIARRDTPEAKGDIQSKTITVPAGGSVTAFDLKGPMAITQLRIQTSLLQQEGCENALRELTLSIFWDGEDVPAVWAPLGDFFGSGYGVNLYQSIPLGVEEESMFSRWYMPFATQAVIRIGNDGKTQQTLTLSVTKAPLRESPDDLLRFHAKWHRNAFGSKQPERYFDDRWPDWPMLLAEGAAGRYCGVSIHLWNPFNLRMKELLDVYQTSLPAVKTPIPEDIARGLVRNWWWGEGDEKFFVDGEAFPSTYGTGTEDYIGYAWGAPVVFDSHTQNQPRNEDNHGHIVISRWHIADNIPFQNSFEAVIEKYHGDNWPLLYAATVYWYQSAGTDDIYGPQSLDERVDYFVMPPLKANAAEGDGKDFGFAREHMGIALIEAETAYTTQLSPGVRVLPQSMERWDGKRWSGGSQLLVRGANTGSSLTFKIPAPDDRPRTLYLFPTKARDYPIFRVEVNGQEAISAFDACSAQVEPAGSVRLGTFTPQDGEFLITISVTGANPRNTATQKFLGFDAIGVK